MFIVTINSFTTPHTTHQTQELAEAYAQAKSAEYLGALDVRKVRVFDCTARLRLHRLGFRRAGQHMVQREKVVKLHEIQDNLVLEEIRVRIKIAAARVDTRWQLCETQTRLAAAINPKQWNPACDKCDADFRCSDGTHPCIRPLRNARA